MKKEMTVTGGHWLHLHGLTTDLQLPGSYHAALRAHTVIQAGGGCMYK